MGINCHSIHETHPQCSSGDGPYPFPSRFPEVKVRMGRMIFLPCDLCILPLAQFWEDRDRCRGTCTGSCLSFLIILYFSVVLRFFFKSPVLLLEGLIPFGVDRLVHVLTLITIKRVEIISEGKCSLENFVNIRFLALHCQCLLN